MNKEITISIEEYKDLIRCKNLFDANNPTSVIIKSDVKFAHWLKQKTTTSNYEVWALNDKVGMFPSKINNAYLDVLDNGTTILSNVYNEPICVLNGSYAIFRAKEEE